MVENSTVTGWVRNTPAGIEEEVVSPVFLRLELCAFGIIIAVNALTFSVARLSNVSHIFSKDKKKWQEKL